MTDELLRDLLITAFEGGSNYWIREVDVVRPKAGDIYDVPLMDGGCMYVQCDECGKAYKLDRSAMRRGSGVLKEKFPKHFSDAVEEDFDATTADCWLQCCLFGDVIFG